MMNKIREWIETYQDIMIYRHVNPDPDAVGSAYGVYCFLKANYPDKNIRLAGTLPQSLKDLFFQGAKVNTDVMLEDDRKLAIVVDTANKERVDGDLSVCEKIIKIDHHPPADAFGDLNYVDDTASSCAQILVTALCPENDGVEIPETAMRALYLGMIADSNRFLYSQTDGRTFRAAARLCDLGLKLEPLYQDFYVESRSHLDVKIDILNRYVYEDGVAYYYLKDEDLKRLGISRAEGSNYVDELANIAEFKIYAALTENVEEHTIRVSLRSRDYAVNTVAVQFSGGGHRLASGCTLESEEEIPLLLDKLKELIKHG